jgi:hypothetical protein
MDFKVWRANVAAKELTTEPVPESWSKLGGRALIPRIPSAGKLVEVRGARSDPTYSAG